MQRLAIFGVNQGDDESTLFLIPSILLVIHFKARFFLISVDFCACSSTSLISPFPIFFENTARLIAMGWSMLLSIYNQSGENQIFSSMRNREIIEYLVYPRIFNAHSVLYKGTYCVAFSVYNLTKNKTLTSAYPFLLRNCNILPPTEFKEEPCLHADGNFSYLTHKFEITYEEEKKRIESQCIFRLEFDLNKNYRVFMTVKLLRKVANIRSQQEMGLCVRKQSQCKFQAIDEQVLELRKDSFNNYERIYFRTSEFFSSIDLYISNFNYGYKHYRSKMQISNMVAQTDLYLHNPAAKMREKCELIEKRRSQDANYYKNELLKDFQAGLPSYYYELLKMIVEHKRLVNQYQQFASLILKDQDRNKARLPQPTFWDLDYVKMNDKVTLKTLQHHYSASTPEQILAHILEQKQLVRKNIRRLREQFCLLLPFQTEKQFIDLIVKQVQQREASQQKHFVEYVSDLMSIEEAPQKQARSHAVEEFTRNKCIWNSTINSAPYFYIQNHTDDHRRSKQKVTTLTVFVHGYQGNSFDFQKAKNYLRCYNKHTHILIVESITNDMNQSIECLGMQVAQEVTRYMDTSIYHFAFINFVGFSLGGLIVRAALPLLKDYWDRFNLFATFSSPHLGISECDNNLVNIGVWYLIKVDKVKNLKELNFQSVKFGDSLLMKLSQCEGLSQFRKVVLVCSKNDGFVPYYSTVLDERKCEKKEIRELCKNITSKFSHIERVEMVFDIENSGTLDKLTGRKGHIEFLDNDYFLQIFFRIYAPFM